MAPKLRVGGAAAAARGALAWKGPSAVCGHCFVCVRTGFKAGARESATVTGKIQHWILTALPPPGLLLLGGPSSSEVVFDAR